MRNLIVAFLLMLSLTASAQTAHKKLSQITVDLVDANTFFVCVDSTGGGFSDFRCTIQDLANYIGAIGGGANFANTDLTLLGNRIHNFRQAGVEHGMTWDSVYYFNLVDSVGDTVFSINNFFAPHNIMFRMSTYNGAIVLNSKNQRAGLSLQSPTTVLNNGATYLNMTSVSGNNFARIGIAGVNPFTIDSATHLITIGVCPNCITWNWTTGEFIVNNAYRMARVAPTDSTQVLTGPAGFAADAFWSYPRTAIDKNVIDANYVIPSVNRTIFLPVITADRTLTIPTPSAFNGTGVMLEIAGQNTGGFNWNLAGATVKKVNGTTVTQMNIGMFRLRWEGTYWLTD